MQIIKLIIIINNIITFIVKHIDVKNAKIMMITLYILFSPPPPPLPSSFFILLPSYSFFFFVFFFLHAQRSAADGTWSRAQAR